jgi:hypothetical protein
MNTYTAYVVETHVRVGPHGLELSKLHIFWAIANRNVLTKLKQAEIDVNRALIDSIVCI